MVQKNWFPGIVAVIPIILTTALALSPQAYAASPQIVPPANQILDIFGNTWTLSQGIVLANGSASAAYNQSQIIELVYTNNTLFEESDAGSWWVWVGTGWNAVSTPPVVSDAAISGACGVASGVPSSSAPTINLCSRGTASAMSSRSPWTWSCAGQNGGIAASCSTANAGGTFYVDPSAASNGSGTLTAPYNSWAAVSFKPGNTYLQKANTIYNDPLWINGVSGTATSPVVIGSYGSGAAPIVHNAIINNSAYITVKGFDIENGVNITDATPISYVSILNNTITSPASYGIYSTGAGIGDVISGNIINKTGTFGIVLNGTGGVSATYNTITGSGSDGIMCFCANANIVNNIVSDGGLIVPGSSGIHIYGGNLNSQPWPKYTQGNVIKGNVVYDMHDTTTDGDGILLDQNTFNNTVTANLVFWNDGQGIYIYDSWDNTITSNTLFNNGVTSTAVVGNITLGASPLEWVYGNFIANNFLLVSNVNTKATTGPFGFEVTPDVVPGSNTFSNNSLFATILAGTGEADYRLWGSPSVGGWTVGDSASFWNAYPTHINPDNLNTAEVSNIASTNLPMQFIIPDAYKVGFNLNGRKVTLYGWRIDTGLYGTFN